MGRRSDLLADRIEEGAAGLAAYVEGLSETDWRTPMSTGNDRRPVGVIVHHVASVYPIEIDRARAIDSGKADRDVTWDAVAQMNAGHAADPASGMIGVTERDGKGAKPSTSSAWVARSVPLAHPASDGAGCRRRKIHEIAIPRR